MSSRSEVSKLRRQRRDALPVANAIPRRPGENGTVSDIDLAAVWRDRHPNWVHPEAVLFPT